MKTIVVALFMLVCAVTPSLLHAYENITVVCNGTDMKISWNSTKLVASVINPGKNKCTNSSTANSSPITLHDCAGTEVDVQLVDIASNNSITTEPVYKVKCSDGDNTVSASVTQISTPSPINDTVPIKVELQMTFNKTVPVTIGDTVTMKISPKNAMSVWLSPKSCKASSPSTQQTLQLYDNKGCHTKKAVDVVAKSFSFIPYNSNSKTGPALETTLIVFEFVNDNSHTVNFECTVHVCASSQQAACSMQACKKRRRREAEFLTGPNASVKKVVKGILHVQSTFHKGIQSGTEQVPVSWLTVSILYMMAWAASL